MGVDALWQRELQSHQDRGPDHGVEPEDLLADDVVGGRPVRGAASVRFALRFAEPQGRGIVEQGVDPDVDHVPGIVGHGHAPAQIRAAHGDVLETLAEPSQDLVPPGLRAHEVRLLGEEGLQPIAIGAEAKVVIVLLRPRQRGSPLVVLRSN